jgi:hypothetical protein
MTDDTIFGPKSYDEQQSVKSLGTPEEGVVANSDPLALDIPDKELVKIINRIEEDEKKFYDGTKNLTERRKKNVTYRFGRQIDDKEKREELKKYESRFLDNVIYEIETSLKPLAMSHLPDMIVLPGTQDPEKIQSAKDLSLAINNTNKKRKQRRVLAMGFSHLPVYFTASIKVRWDPSLGKDGDFRFDIVHPNRLIIGHNAKSNDTDEIEVVLEKLPVKVQELLMRFPAKADDLKEELIKDGVQLDDKDNWKDLATEVNATEVHFTWYKKKGTKELIKEPTLDIFEPGVKWEKVELVIWKYGNVILDKMLDPNFDYEGEDMYFTQDDPNDPATKRELKPEEMVMRMMTGDTQGIQKERIYHNYFSKPKKPYFFFGYEQWGEQPLDETSRIEQNIRNQENLDDLGKRLVDKLKQRVKHIWGRESGLKAGDIQKLDMENPMLDVLVDGDLTKVHKDIQPERPDAAEYKSLQENKDRMYSVAHASAIRGELQSDVATTNQIGREADFTTTDDLVEETINAACEWMAEWQMQFIKLRYTEDHMMQLAGSKGATTLLRLRRDSASDGMEVTTKASTTDKLKAQKNALDMANAKLIDPLTFYEDMEMSDPEGRAEKLMLFSTDPATYMTKYIMKLENTPALIGALNGTQPAPQLGGAQPAPVAPQNPTVTDTAAVPAQPPIGNPASPNNGIL